MTPPHIEAAARALDPLAFEDWTKCPPRGMKGWHDVSIRNAQSSRQKRAIKSAAVVWNLAMKEAAKVGKAEARNQISMASAAHYSGGLSEHEINEGADEVEAAIRALAVEE